MKKTSNGNIFKKIFRVFDKLLITPLAKLILGTGNAFKGGNRSGIDKILNKKQSLLVISLIAACAIFFAVDQKITTLIDDSAEVLYNQPVKAIYNEELYVVEGVPKTADVTIIGRKEDVYLAKQYPADEIIVDLKDLKAGTHKVSAKYKQSVLSVEYKIDPSTLTVVIYEKMSANRELSYDVIHKDKLDSKLNIESVTLNRDTVIIKGADYKLEKVASVKALVDVESITSQKVGSATLEDVPLVAYDKDGKIVDVEIVPEKVQATVKISSPSKSVPIKIETVGELDNRAIKSLTPSQYNVVIYGPNKSLEDIEYVTAEIDVDKVKEDKKYTVTLKKPTGVREMSIEKITVDMKLDSITTKEVTGVKINSINLGNGLKVQALSKEDSNITVILKGSSSVLKTIDSSSIKAYIDLADLTVGDHEVEIKVSGTDNRIVYSSNLKKVRIRISKDN